LAYPLQSDAKQRRDNRDDESIGRWYRRYFGIGQCDEQVHASAPRGELLGAPQSFELVGERADGGGLHQNRDPFHTFDNAVIGTLETVLARRAISRLSYHAFASPKVGNSTMTTPSTAAPKLERAGAVLQVAAPFSVGNSLLPLFAH